MDLKVKGRTVLVTGGSRGIGRHVALQYAAEGAKVALTYNERADLSEKIVADIEAGGGQAMALRMDLGSEESIRNTVAEVEKKFGGVDILINNAVRWAERLQQNQVNFEDTPGEEWRAVLRVNIEGAYAAIQAVLPGMRKKKWGRIINVSSMIALNGSPGNGTYGAAKSALHGLTRSLAKEVGRDGILVNVVAPGLVVTERNLERVPQFVRDGAQKASSIGYVLPPEEIAPIILFLASGLNTGTTGQIVTCSGG